MQEGTEEEYVALKHQSKSVNPSLEVLVIVFFYCDWSRPSCLSVVLGVLPGLTAPQTAQADRLSILAISSLIRKAHFQSFSFFVCFYFFRLLRGRSERAKMNGVALSSVSC